MNLQQLLFILRARIKIFLATIGLTVLTTTVVTLLIPKTYTASATVIVSLKDDQIGPFGTPVYLQPGYLETQSDIIASHKVALKVVNDLKLATSPTARESFQEETHGKGTIQDWLADRLAKKVDVKTTRSSIMQIDFSATDGRFAALVANAFAQAYVDTNLELHVEPARQSSQWFASQLKQLRQNLETAQTNLTAYQQKNGVASVDEKTDVESARHAALSTQLVQAQAETYQTLSRQRQAEEFLARGAPLESLPDVLANGFIMTLKGSLLGEEAKLHDFEAQYGKNHPRYQRQSADVESMREKLAAEIKKVMASIANANKINQQREAEIRNALASQKSTVLSLKHGHDQLAVLLREVGDAQNAYDDALKRSRQASQESQVISTNVAVLNPAIEPLSPSRPRVPLNIALAFIIGSMLGAAGVFLLELFDRRVRTGQDLVQALDMPLLASFKNEAPAGPAWWRWLISRWQRRFSPVVA